MRYLVLIFVFALFSCNQKQGAIESNMNIQKASQTEFVHDAKEKKQKKILINGIYNESDLDFSDVRVNYGTAKFTVEDDFIIDSTLSEDEKYFRLKDYKLKEYTDDRSLIRISNYTFSLQKTNGFLNIGLFRRMENNDWKCKDIKELERYSELGDYNYVLGGHKVFCYTCETSKGDFCFAVVIDKVNSEGKYDKILKAVKFDLISEKIIVIDLNKEKIECLPEESDE